jgi:transcriptional regulator with GAF, ATPase, and Fis domain
VIENKKKILCLIDEISTVLALLIELKKKGQFREALENINKTLLEYFNCDHEFIYSVSEDFLINALKEEKGLSTEELSSLAELLHEKGDILFKQNNLKASSKILRNALKIYFFLNEDQDFFSFKNMNKMVLINDKLSKINLKIEN